MNASKPLKVPIIPEAWKIVGGKLYLNNNRNVHKRFEQNYAEIIHGADLNGEIIRPTPKNKFKKPIIR
ncbi:hypothetical protein HPQ64_15815 [Rhizobiales bacterium]|uniref:hypothetical protein n=1 Tax=Hongsoonwoonella zoysiae TaxID=2821844 RepID=UPI0015610222|nr:hypothetical protein [Hongsoonwoonella zoysiae]NRG19158.1 hypothetical protein [Hongsoonwoonella zoysiae]